MRPADLWTPERIAMLVKLWAAGATAQAIAGQLGGVSRAAVLGKIFRLRGEAATPAPDGIAAKQISPDAKSAGATTPTRRRGSGKWDTKWDTKRGTKDDGSPHHPRPMPRRGKSLLELTNESCRWPHGRPGTARFHFCGAPGADLEGGMPYCPQHAQRAYLKHPRLPEGSKPQVTGSSDLTETPARRRRYVWRAPVRHPAARWK